MEERLRCAGKEERTHGAKNMIDGRNFELQKGYHENQPEFIALKLGKTVR